MGLGLHNASAGAIVYDCQVSLVFFMAFNIGGNDVANSLTHPWVQVRYQSLRRWQLREFLRYQVPFWRVAAVTDTIRSGIVDIGQLGVSPNPVYLLDAFSTRCSGILAIICNEAWSTSINHMPLLVVLWAVQSCLALVSVGLILHFQRSNGQRFVICIFLG